MGKRKKRDLTKSIRDIRLMEADTETLVSDARFVLECLECSERRESQVRLLDEIMRHLGEELPERIEAFYDERPYSVRALACEATTGIGKSFVILSAAYVLWARIGVKSVVSTYSKMLQTQYERSRYDFVERLGRSMKFAEQGPVGRFFEDTKGNKLRPLDILELWKMGVRMGKGNYLCRRRLERAKRMFGMTGSMSYGKNGAVMIGTTFANFLHRFEALGDIGQNMEFWPSHIRNDPCAEFVRASGSTPCKGCPAKFVSHCRYIASIGEDSPLTVANHALTLAEFRAVPESKEDLDVSDRQSSVDRFPPVAFFDEGHHLMGLSTGSGVLLSVTYGDVKSACSWAFPDTAFPRSGGFDEEGFDLGHAYDATARYLAERSGLERALFGLIEFREDESSADWLGRAKVFLEETAGNGVEGCAEMVRVLSETPRRSFRYAALRDQIMEAAAVAAKIRRKLERAVAEMESDGTRWSVLGTDDGLVVRENGLSRVEMGTEGRMELEALSAAVVLSGTLAGAGRGDQAFADESGLALSRGTVRFPEQFDSGRLQIWIPRDFPRPPSGGRGGEENAASDWERAVVRFLKTYVPPYIELGYGGVLVLSTSVARAERYGLELEQTARGGRWSVHVVGVGDSTKKHIRRFVGARGRACLIGSESFREGFDAPGRTLTWAIVDRLPYERADERFDRRMTMLERSGAFDEEARILAAKAEAETEEPLDFEKTYRSSVRTVRFDHAGDLMEIKLRQSVGRVLRMAGDSGFFTLLDPRACPDSRYATPRGVRAAAAACPARNPWMTDLPSSKEWILERVKPFFERCPISG